MWIFNTTGTIAYLCLCSFRFCKENFYGTPSFHCFVRYAVGFFCSKRLILINNLTSEMDYICIFMQTCAIWSRSRTVLYSYILIYGMLPQPFLVFFAIRSLLVRPIAYCSFLISLEKAGWAAILNHLTTPALLLGREFKDLDPATMKDYNIFPNQDGVWLGRDLAVFL